MPLRIDPRVAWQTVDGQGVVMDLVNGRVLGLNAVGSLVWSLLPDHDEPAIVDAVCGRFEVDADQARRDLREFLDALRSKQLVTEA